MKDFQILPISTIIPFDSKLSNHEISINELTHVVRRLREELKTEKSNFKSFREQAIHNVQKLIEKYHTFD